MSSIALQQHHSKHFAHREECDKNIQQISIANNQSKGPPKVRSWPAALPRNANLFDPGGYHSSLVAHDQHCCLPLYIHSFTAASSCYSATANDVAGQILFLIDTCGLVFSVLRLNSSKNPLECDVFLKVIFWFIRMLCAKHLTILCSIGVDCWKKCVMLKKKWIFISYYLLSTLYLSIQHLCICYTN